MILVQSLKILSRGHDEVPPPDPMELFAIHSSIYITLIAHPLFNGRALYVSALFRLSMGLIQVHEQNELLCFARKPFLRKPSHLIQDTITQEMIYEGYAQKCVINGPNVSLKRCQKSGLSLNKNPFMGENKNMSHQCHLPFLSSDTTPLRSKRQTKIFM